MNRSKPDTGPPVLHRGVGMPTKCRSCPAMITFAVLPASKKLAPFVEDPQGHYILENGTARHVGAPTAQVDLFTPPAEVTVQRYSSHFADCPASNKFRSRDA